MSKIHAQQVCGETGKRVMFRKAVPILTMALFCLSLPACQMQAKEGDEGHKERQKIVATSPAVMDVIITQPYVCQIRSQTNIEVRVLQEGYLKEIKIKEGQLVKKGEVMFEVIPVLYQTRLDAERAKANLMQIKFNNTKSLHERTPPVVSIQEVNQAQAELDEANAKVKTSEAELSFATYRAPVDGIVDRQMQQQGALIDKKDVITTLSDNSIIRAYFNVPEARYLEDMAGPGLNREQIELVLADGNKFSQHCLSVIREGQFNNQTGNIAYRADFPNPKYILRHGQTGTVLIHRDLHNVIVIPQRATYEILDKQYVYVIDKDNLIHQREIIVAHEKDDIFIIKSGLDANDKIVFEGVRQVHEGEKLENFEFRKPEEALSNQKYHAE